MELNIKLNDSILLPREKDILRKLGYAVKNFEFISRCYDSISVKNRKTGQRFDIRY